MPTDVFAFGRDFVNGHRAVRLDRAHVEFRGRSGKLRFGEIGRPRSGKTASRDAGRLSRERNGQQGKREKEQYCSHGEYHSTNECRVKHRCPVVGWTRRFSDRCKSFSRNSDLLVAGFLTAAPESVDVGSFARAENFAPPSM